MSESDQVRKQFAEFVLGTYARFEPVLTRGEGNYVWDADGKRYLDFGGGIAVCVLGHAHPEIADVIADQARTLTHVSNLYYHPWQGQLAEALVREIGPGRVFFCNSGAEANEGLFKLARKFGHERGRFEIIATLGSFHGRTLGGISATGQEKVKHGFEPMVQGFVHVPFNDLAATSAAITDKTAAILLEPIQGEGGITVASAEYLRGLRRLCDEHDLLLLFDEVQSGHFRTGKFQAWQRIVPATAVLPDAVAMAKSLGNGFPIGAFWVREKYAPLLGPGTHGTTFGGTPLASAVALKVLEIIARDRLAENADKLGRHLLERLRELQRKFPRVITEVRGFGLMIGIELRAAAFAEGEKETPSIQATKLLQRAGLLVIPAGTNVLRLLPALNIQQSDADAALELLESVFARLNS